MIQIQHLLKLNIDIFYIFRYTFHIQIQHLLKLNMIFSTSLSHILTIQIQHLLKLNVDFVFNRDVITKFKYNTC